MVKICHVLGDGHGRAKAGGSLVDGGTMGGIAGHEITLQSAARGRKNRLNRCSRNATEGVPYSAVVTRDGVELYYCQELARNAMREISTSRTRGMPKALCMSGMVVAILIAILFLLDLAIKFPFERVSILMDASLLICAAILGLISWFTLREQA